MCLPYYKRFPRDFLDGTIGMSLEEKGAYSILLDLIYMRDGRLVEDAGYIAGQLGCSVRKWFSIRDALISRGKINSVGGFISNSRADKLLDETRLYRDKQAENGNKPKKINVEEKPPHKPEGKPKLNQSESDIETDIDSPPTPPLPDEAPAPEVASEEGSSPKKSRKRPSTPIPDGFPTADVIDKGKEAVFAASVTLDVDRQAFRFRNWALQGDKRYVDWAATFRNWIDKAISEAPKISVTSTEKDEIDWEARMKYFMEKNHWSETRWGPHPKSSYCDVPTAILIKYGFRSQVIEFPKPQPMSSMTADKLRAMATVAETALPI